MVFTRNSARRSWRLVALVAALGLTVGAPAHAQYVGPAAGVSTPPAAAYIGAARPAPVAPQPEARAADGKGGRLLDRMGTGVLIGAGVGLVAAFVHTEITGDYSDHSMDGMAYLVAIPMGALAGLVAGFVVGVTGY